MKRPSAITKQVPFGIRPDGQLVDANQTARGKACECRCPGCGAPLIARQGAVRTAHFSHKSTVDCATAAETALHMAAKQVLLQATRITLPSLVLEASRSDPRFGWFQESGTCFEGRTEWLTAVKAEVWLSGIRPDILATGTDLGQFAIEIRVTHEVDYEKAADIRRRQLPCIEIDLRPYIGSVFSMADLTQHIVEAADNKNWLHHPKEEIFKQHLLSGFDGWLDNQKATLERLELRDAARIAELRRKHDEKRLRRVKIEELNSAYRRRPFEEKWAELKANLGLTAARWPRHLAVTLNCDMSAIQAPPGLWQGALFARFVFGVQADDHRSQLPETRRVVAWVQQRFGIQPLGLESAAKAVAGYLRYLSGCGFLSRHGIRFSVVHGDLYPRARPEDPRRPAQQAGTATRANKTPSGEPVKGVLATTSGERIAWATCWPERTRLLAWANDFCAHRRSSMSAQDVINELLMADWEPDTEDMVDLVTSYGGDPGELFEFLDHCGLTHGSFRIVSAGEHPPWFRD